VVCGNGHDLCFFERGSTPAISPNRLVAVLGWQQMRAGCQRAGGNFGAALMESNTSSVMETTIIR
jgi:hypothetical protein